MRKREKKIRLKQLNKMPTVDDNLFALNDFDSSLCLMGIYTFTLSFCLLFEYKIDGANKEETHHVPGESDVV